MLLDAVLPLVQPEILGGLFLSTSLGVLVGAIPGLTVVLALGLLFGFVAMLPSEYALVILIGVCVGGIYGGSITAILLGIPGTPSSMATLLEGYPLALRGKAFYAIQVTRIASIIGTALGACALLLLTPFLTKFALSFTSPEFFSLALFGVLICGIVSSGETPVKGWISGLLGLLLALIGMDNTESIPRFVFDNVTLLSGISFVPVIIGLYGMSAVLMFYTDCNRESGSISQHGSRSRNALCDVAKRMRLIVQSALVGIGLGVLPGVGEDIAAWTAYGVAKKTSAQPEQFGTGCTDGLIAPEVANNAAIGGSFVPLLSLGIPGSPGAAIFMGALLIYGIRPGPMLLVESPTLFPQMVVTLLLADICLLVSAVILIKPIAALLRVPRHYLMPAILAVSCIGAFAVNLSTFDFIVMLIAGGIGWILQLMRYPLAPIALGMILGKMLDYNFRTTLIISDGSFMPFFTRPISCVLLLLTAVLIVQTLLKTRKNYL